MATNDYSKLMDSADGRKKRQRNRRASLNKAAIVLGFESWSKFETAVVNNVVEVAVTSKDN